MLTHIAESIYNIFNVCAIIGNSESIDNPKEEEEWSFGCWVKLS
jgi:hypothetical protein